MWDSKRGIAGEGVLWTQSVIHLQETTVWQSASTVWCRVASGVRLPMTGVGATLGGRSVQSTATGAVSFDSEVRAVVVCVCVCVSLLVLWAPSCVFVASRAVVLIS